MSGVTLQAHGSRGFTKNGQVDCTGRGINMQPISPGRCKLFSCKSTSIFYLKHVFSPSRAIVAAAGEQAAWRRMKICYLHLMKWTDEICACVCACVCIWTTCEQKNRQMWMQTPAQTPIGSLVAVTFGFKAAASCQVGFLGE